MTDDTTTFYRVQQTESGKPRSYLTGAQSLTDARAHMQSVAENMTANGYQKADDYLLEKHMDDTVLLCKERRTIMLAVIECTTDDVGGTKTTRADRRDMNWLVRINGGSEAISDYTADPDVTPDSWLAKDADNDYRMHIAETVGV